jgi:hypothetical protein
VTKGAWPAGVTPVLDEGVDNQQRPLTGFRNWGANNQALASLHDVENSSV